MQFVEHWPVLLEAVSLCSAWPCEEGNPQSSLTALAQLPMQAGDGYTLRVRICVVRGAGPCTGQRAPVLRVQFGPDASAVWLVW
jgi:hypothetical protein